MAANQVDTIRHHQVFSAAEFGDRAVHMVGCGATGSRVALEVAKLGVENIHLWDFDHVESHNLANQVFGLRDVGMPKVMALARRIEEDTGLTCACHNEAVTKDTRLDGVVFLQTDTMASRKEIWDGCLKLQPWVDLMIETRMGKDEGRVYSVRPTSKLEYELWESRLYTDEQSSESLCGSKITVGPTAALIHAHAVWTMIRWFNWYEKGVGDSPAVETILGINPPGVYTFSPRVGR